MLPQLVATNFDAEFEALSYKVFFKWTNPGLFFVYFCPLKQTIQFLQQINVKNVHPVSSARIRTHNLLITSLLSQPPDQGSRPYFPHTFL